MKLNFTIVISVSVLFLILLSCEDYQIPQGQRFRLKATRTIGLGLDDTSLVTRTYDYDGNGGLVRYVVSTERRPVSVVDSTRTILSYNAQGRIEKDLVETWDLVLNASGLVHLWRPALSSAYEYDVSGNSTVMKIAGITKDRSQDPFLLEELRLEYNSTKFPVKVTHTRASDSYEWVERYTYSGGNIIKVEKSDNQSMNVMTTFQYDDKPNPFYGLIIGEKSNDAFNTFNRNNVVTGDKQYSYDSNGLLTKIAQRDGSAETIYEYETY